MKAVPIGRGACAAVLDAAIVMAALSATAADRASAESLSNAGGRASVAHLDFSVVIPAVLVLDTRSGAVFSNDRRSPMLLGVSSRDGSAAMDATTNRSTLTIKGDARAMMAFEARWRPAQNGGRFTARAVMGRSATRRVADGDIVCAP